MAQVPTKVGKELTGLAATACSNSLDEIESEVVFEGKLDFFQTIVTMIMSAHEPRFSRHCLACVINTHNRLHNPSGNKMPGLPAVVLAPFSTDEASTRESWLAFRR